MAMTKEADTRTVEQAPAPWLMSKAQYLSIDEQGFFDGKRVELVFGTVMTMAPSSAPHVESTRLVQQKLLLALHGRAIVYGQSSFDATEDSVPEPDVAVVPLGSYWSALATRAHLIVEVSRSSADYDRRTKARLYALAEVDEYWIVDHNTRTVVVHRDRADIGWATVLTFRAGQTISPVAFPDVQIAVDEILPP